MALLLLIIAIGQVLPVVEQLSEAEKPTPVEQVSEGCIKAREQAEGVLSLDLSFLKDFYVEDVYGEEVSNIYQQTFRVGEYQYMTLVEILLQQQALLRVVTECNW